MKKFLDENFLLQSEIAQDLYHNFAKQQPIIDYHNHLIPEQIANNKQFDNITQVWLNGDHYKWRAMRTFGIKEKYITGDATDKEKFLKWAETVPYTMRNPLYHWTHLELQRYFGITDLLTPKTAEKIYEQTAEKLGQPEFSVRGLLKKMNVEVVCTTDDPIDSLNYHKQFASEKESFKMLPAFRPDKAMQAEDVAGMNDYIQSLEKVSNKSIGTYQEYIQALKSRHDYFAENGCSISDHGLEQIYAEDFSDSEISKIFDTLRTGKALSPEDVLKFKSAMLLQFAEWDHEKGWVQQYHLGALRNNNARMLRVNGPDTGWDSIGDFSQARALSKFLNRLDDQDKLAKTILYNLNPADNELIATMIGNFNDGSIKGKIQFGSAWWFLDQKDGMTKQINALSNMGLLSCLVGMLTDSRSFLSFPRHEYFRRLICDIFGQDVVNGELPDDRDLIGGIIKDISYNNAKTYFNF
ncbi:glucuronate isomerase [Sphingobacterium lactis]|uniref:Uronate isomerase n=1 Tax=Sphingobacterium lactis TaxID=797291 RepID=A0A1H6C6P7_9SPHI|nr:glucuronate isomerase [Sphingobacterium lactis]SEG68056.1 glucuronate isomerase [Sphingobacterium lactis]